MDRKGRKNGIMIRQSFEMLNFLSFGLRWDILFTELQLLRKLEFIDPRMSMKIYRI